MVVIIVSIVIIATRGVIFFESSTMFFICDGCDHCECCDNCHKRGHFSEKLYNVFFVMVVIIVGVVIMVTKRVSFQKCSTILFL